MPADEKLKNQVKSFLQIHRTASLATVSEHGEPQVATVNYVLDDNFNFFFIVRKHSRKFKNLESNKKVGILVGGDPQIPVIVQMQGIAEPVRDEKNIVEYFSKEVELNDKSWDVLFKTPGVDFMLFKVKIEWLRWLNLNLTAYPETYMKDFEQIIP
jgi:general stress protein 26